MDTPKPSGEDMQQLVERFHRAGWITGVSMVSDDPVSMEFTTLGQRRMREIFSVMESTKPENRSATSEQAIVSLLADALSELEPPRISSAEWELLQSLALSFSRRATQQ